MKKTVALILTLALFMIPSFAVDQAENEPVNVIESEFASAGNGARLSSSPIMISPIQYEEFPYDESIKLDWMAPQEIGVSYYRVRVRRFNFNNAIYDEEYDHYFDAQYAYIVEDNLIIDTVVNAQTTEFDISHVFLGSRCKYRYAIAAVTVDRVEYWTEGYFYTGVHNGILSSPISFRIGNYFSDLTKNQIYYACQTWNNELYLDYEAVNTYPFSQGTDTTVSVEDGYNCIVGSYTALGNDYVSMAYTYIDENEKCKEADIVLNRNKTWANSAQVDKTDVQSVITHELGHVLGLGDKYDNWLTDYTMWYIIGTNSIAQRSPVDDESFSALNFVE